jgi:hypothetical protein
MLVSEVKSWRGDVMMLFSQRMRLKPIKSIIQKDSMDEELRNGLWNALDISCSVRMNTYAQIKLTSLHTFFVRLWHSYFKWPLDTLPDLVREAYSIIREYFFACEWYEVYDFIEFVVANDESLSSKEFMDFCNSVMERELSAYRFVGGKITPITSEEEIQEIESALRASSPFEAVRLHLRAALDKLSDRKAPDYRNSIKESISAVEALARLITGDEKAELGKALNIMEKKMGLHGALKRAFSALYGYTSNAEGIRHAMLEEPSLTFADAKFMLVSCSAFSNYLIAKCEEHGLKLGKN